MLKEQFEESTFPYFVDIVHFDKVQNEFKENVFNNNGNSMASTLVYKAEWRNL